MIYQRTRSSAEQYELALGDRQVVLPWSGRSPRSLTRGFVARSLASEGTGRLTGDAECLQYKLRLEGGSFGS